MRTKLNLTGNGIVHDDVPSNSDIKMSGVANVTLKGNIGEGTIFYLSGACKLKIEDKNTNLKNVQFFLSGAACLSLPSVPSMNLVSKSGAAKIIFPEVSQTLGGSSTSMMQSIMPPSQSTPSEKARTDLAPVRAAQDVIIEDTSKVKSISADGTELAYPHVEKKFNVEKNRMEYSMNDIKADGEFKFSFGRP